MSRKYTIVLPKGFTLDVSTQCAKREPQGFKMGWCDDPHDKEETPRRVRTLRYLSASDADKYPTDPEDIEKIVPWFAQSYYEYSDPMAHDKKMVYVDKTELKNIFPPSNMEVSQVIPISELPFRYLSDFHYFLQLQTASKGRAKKEPSVENRELYTVIWKWLHETKQVMLVNFNANDKCKIGAVYPTTTNMVSRGKGVTDRRLMMTLIIHQTHQNLEPVSHVSDPNDVMFKQASEIGESLFADFKKTTLDKELLIDHYWESVNEYILAKISGSSLPEQKITAAIPPKTDVMNKLNALLAKSETIQRKTSVKIIVDDEVPKKHVRKPLVMKTLLKRRKTRTKKIIVTMISFDPSPILTLNLNYIH